MDTKKQPLFSTYQENVDYLHKHLGVDESFDVIHLNLEYMGRKMSLFLIDGFAKDEILHFIMKFFAKLEPKDLEPDPLKKLLKTYIPYIELGHNQDLNKTIDLVLGGPIALVVEGIDEIIMIDARTYPVRQPAEPDLERVVRGSRDGYVETIVFNTALTRRRVRDKTLRMEYLQVGRRSKTDIALCYIADIADAKRVEKMKKDLERIDTDGLPMAEKTIEEYLSGRHWNPYPTVRYTERPDTAAAHLFEGHVLIIIDGSPSVMITPATYWHHLQHAEEYRQKPVIGAYLRMVRFIAVMASMFLLPLYFLFSSDPTLLPASADFIGPAKEGTIPLILQFLIAEIGVDMLRMAALHTPSSLVTALGLVAAVLMGQVAVEVGVFSNEVVLYIAIAAIGTYATPSYELSLANRLVRIFLLVVTSIFGVAGYVVGITAWLLYIVRIKSYEIAYVWPFLPFSYRAFRDIFLRSPIPLKNRRPTFLDPQDPDK
ncbi:spore germination protein [Virgibacillus phasianinus]|uniref:Spore germination protein n=1 Tax=Virgibacillus phasianinus TaxID=2017483 RepID=A0A220U570_9BACI|nr:spore germination protein [Virgibacillus phasianinus]ASK63195.1 spore germination protein [Virgibacillus phasianinus]